MKTLQRTALVLTLLAFLVTPSVFFAQEENTVTVTGSGVVSGILTALADSVEADLSLDVRVTGTTAGFRTFCEGQADLTGAVRPISIEEEAACLENSVEYTEFLAGYSVLAVITHPDIAFGECLSAGELSSILAPSAQDIVTTWNAAGIEGASEDALNIVLPADNTALYALLDRVVDGVGLRRDVETVDADAIVDAVASTPFSIGVVSLSAARQAGDTVQVVSLRSDTGECITPSVEAVESRQYTAYDQLLVYVDRADLEKPGLRDLLSLLTDETSAASIEAAGYTAPSASVFETNSIVLELGEAGRQFTLGLTEFEIPEALFGIVQIGGASGPINYLQAVTTQFTLQYPGVSVNMNLRGESEGQRRLCNGEIDLLAAYSDLPAEQAENCAANNITTLRFDLGSRAVILVGNEADEFAACLTPDAIRTIWSTGADGTVTSWDAVQPDFPAQDVILVAPAPGTQGLSDLLLAAAGGPVPPRRTDVAETRNDPLYRAAAVANVSGGLTYMSWQEYQRVVESGQEGIQLVAVDAGQGCVTPSVETISSGEYPLSQSFSMLVSQVSLARTEVQSLLWYMFSDANYDLFAIQGVTGPVFGSLPTQRETLQAAFTEALAAGVEPVTEVDAEQTPEAEDGDAEETPEEESEATPEVTPES